MQAWKIEFTAARGKKVFAKTAKTFCAFSLASASSFIFQF